MEDEGKKCLRGFPADRKIVSAWEKMHFLASCHAFGNIRAWVRVSTADLAISSG